MSAAGNSLLIVDHDEAARTALALYLRSRGLTVFEATSVQAAERKFRDASPDVALVDLGDDGVELVRVLRRIDERVPILMVTPEPSVELTVRAIKLGAENFVSKRLPQAAFHMQVQRVLDSSRDRRRQLARTTREARSQLDPFVGKSLLIRDLMAQAHQVLDSHTPILIEGETGTGKGVLAHWFHEHGPRADEPFVDINCAGLSRDLLESELFGHERGSFTGAATSKLGLLEVAHRGTAFLDEIGEIDLALQPRILKVVEEKRFRRVGDVRNHHVDVRLITATNRDLGRMSRDGSFRADLYFRINTIHLVIPPLRRRPEDLPELARQVLEHIAPGRQIELAADAASAIQRHAWPGNLRELRNVFERAVLVAGAGNGGRIEAADLRFEAMPELDADVLTLDEVERRHVEHVVRIEHGNVDRAAARLGVSRSTLYTKLKRYRDDTG